jgi:hypothetical protein
LRERSSAIAAELRAVSVFGAAIRASHRPFFSLDIRSVKASRALFSLDIRSVKAHEHSLLGSTRPKKDYFRVLTHEIRISPAPPAPPASLTREVVEHLPPRAKREAVAQRARDESFRSAYRRFQFSASRQICRYCR